jgi:hypothetical protein
MVELVQTETAQYRLDGLLLVIEAIGRVTPMANLRSTPSE